MLLIVLNLRFYNDLPFSKRGDSLQIVNVIPVRAFNLKSYHIFAYCWIKLFKPYPYIIRQMICILDFDISLNFQQLFNRFQRSLLKLHSIFQIEKSNFNFNYIFIEISDLLSARSVINGFKIIYSAIVSALWL